MPGDLHTLSQDSRICPTIKEPLVGTFLSPPEDDEILKHFYKTTRPWGAWGPIRDQVMREDPSFRPNTDFGRDCVNVTVGLVWQLCLTALPIFIVLQSWQWVGGILITLVITSIFIKFNWYDKLPPADDPVSTLPA